MPENTSFMIAGYVVFGVIVVGYALVLWRRGRQ
jgi:hypothetical protein